MPTRNLECDLVWNESLCRSNQGEELDVRSPGSGWALQEEEGEKETNAGKASETAAQTGLRPQPGASEPPEVGDQEGPSRAVGSATRRPSGRTHLTKPTPDRPVSSDTWVPGGEKLASAGRPAPCHGPTSPTGTPAPGSLAAGHGAPPRGGHQHFRGHPSPCPEDGGSGRAEVRQAPEPLRCSPACLPSPRS